MRILSIIMMAAAFAAIMPQAASSQQAENTSRTYGAWQVVCGETDAGARCSLLQQQAATDAAGTRQRLLAIELQPAGDAVRGTLILPFGLDLAKGARLSLAGAPGDALPFKTCLPAGCLVDVGFGAQSLAAMSQADILEVVVVPLQEGGIGTMKLVLEGFAEALGAARAGRVD